MVLGEDGAGKAPVAPSGHFLSEDHFTDGRAHSREAENPGRKSGI